MIKSWLYAAIAGLLIAVVGLVADGWMIDAMAKSVHLGKILYDLRFVALPGIMASVILTGLASGNLHSGGQSYGAYLLVAFIANWVLYGCLIHFFLTRMFGAQRRW